MNEKLVWCTVKHAVPAQQPDWCQRALAMRLVTFPASGRAQTVAATFGTTLA
jgi:hypothetical protein